MKEFVKKYYQDSTGKEWKDLYDRRIENNLAKTYKKHVIENIKYLRSIGLEDSRIASILVKAPELFTLEPNPENNNSLDKKIKFFAEYGHKPESSLLVAHKLYDYELYENSNATKVVKALDNNLDNKELVGKILYGYPNILSIDASEIGDRLNFWQKQTTYIEVPFEKFIYRWPALLHYSVDPTNAKSIQSKLNFYKKRFHLSDTEVMKQVYEFPVFVGLDINPEKKGSVQVKTAKLNELGFGDTIIGRNLKVLSAPANKVKARYIICRNFGISRESFLSSKKYMFHEKKLYSRAKFLQNNPQYGKSLIAATEVRFRYTTQRGTYNEFKFNDVVYKPLVEEYPLTEEAMHAEEEKFNHDRVRLVELNDDELDAVTGRKDAAAEEALENLNYTYIVNTNENNDEFSYDVSFWGRE